MAVEEFEKQRKLVARVMAAEDWARPSCVTKLVQRFAGEWSIGDCALIGAMVDYFPTFRVVLDVTDRFAEIGSKRRPPHKYSRRIGLNRSSESACMRGWG